MSSSLRPLRDFCGLGANDARALASAVNDVIDSGIPIVMFDRNVDGAKKELPYFGLDKCTAAIDALVAFLREKKPIEGELLTPVLIEKSNLTSAERIFRA